MVEASPGASDAGVLALAVKEKRIILTFDRDYGTLIYHKRQAAPEGVIYFRFDPRSPQEPADRLLELLQIV